MAEQPTIAGIRAHEVVAPARKGATDSESMGGFMDGVVWHQMPIVLLEFRSSDDVVALGEVTRGFTIGELRPMLEALVGVKLAGVSLATLPPAFRQPPMWNLLEMHAPPLWASPSPVLAAVEVALLDWAGKRLGCRAVDLLGGAYRDRVSVDYWCGRQSPADLGPLVARARELGFRGIKTKSRSGDPTVAQIKAIKSAGGADFGVTIDPMFQWHSPHDALHTFRSLDRFANVRIEDPFPQDRPEFWQRVRSVSGVPLIWHARGIDPARRALEARCADGFNCSGGIAEFLTIAHAVETAGYSCWHGSMIELGVGQAAHLHAAAAARCCTMASDFCSGFVREHTLVTWDWPYRDGSLPLPPGPGLGVELDLGAVAQAARAQATFGTF